jgi:putative ABC transport system substrate-binding protein
VDLIECGGIPEALAAKNATSTIPIVYFSGGDPVEAGLVTSLNRPGANVTGVTNLTVELGPKRFELLREIVPRATVIGLLVNPNNPNAARDVRDASRPAGVRLEILKAGQDAELKAAFASLARSRDAALVVAPDPFIFSQREQVVALAERHGLPTIYSLREYVSAGGLVSYGANLPALYRQVGIYSGMILKGAKPADMPVHQPTTFELVINMKAAKALGLAIPPVILTRADEVIE